MSDWKPGDLALCVDAEENRFWPGHAPQRGRVYTVESVSGAGIDRRGISTIGLALVELPAPADYAATRFRKIRPHTPDEQDAETIRLLNGVPVKEPTHA